MRHLTRAGRFGRSAAAAAALFAAASSTVSAQHFIGLNFAGTHMDQAAGQIPAHASGAVGIDHVVEFVKGRAAIYRKSDGALVQALSPANFWLAAGVGTAGTTLSYPRVIYDHASQRWFASSIDVVGSTANTNNVLLAVSSTPDPRGAWKGFKIDPNNLFADFVTLGLDADGVYLASNNYDSSGNYQNASVISIPKSHLLAATPTVAGATIFSSESGVDRGLTMQPVVNFEGSQFRGNLVGVDLEQFGTLAITDVHNARGPGAATLSETGYVSVPDNLYPLKARQPDGTRNLDAGDDRIGATVYRVGNVIYAAHTTAVGNDNAIRWYKINELNDTLMQSGTIITSGRDLYFPAISANANGEVVIAFTRSSSFSGEFPSSYAVVGRTTGGVTTFGTPFALKNGVASYHDVEGNRWGAYTSASPDPADPQIFWTTQPFAAASNKWQVQTSEIIVPLAGEVRWRNPANGNFSPGANWFGGASPAAVAGAKVIFSRATNPDASGYTVTFDGNYTNDSARVHQGQVTFNLNGNTYNLTSATAPSFIVGEFGGNARLTISNGTLNTTAAAIAPGPISIAQVTLQSRWQASGNVNVGSTSPNGSAALILSTGAEMNSPLLRAWNNGVIHLAGGTVSGTSGPGSGSVRLAGGRVISYLTHTLAPPVTIEAGGGTIQVQAGTLTLPGALSIAASQALTKVGAGTLTLSGAHSHGPGSTLTASTGTLNLNSNAGSSAVANLTLNVASTTNLNSTQNLLALNVSNNATATLTGINRTIKTRSLAITGGGKLNLTSNALVIDYLGAATPAALIRGYLASGRNEGAWNGPGIYSSAIGNNPLFGLASAEASDVLGITGFQTALWGGQTVDASSFLVRYTYDGDANLDGMINIDDYGQIDFNVGLSGQVFGYFNGDFNYDGLINIDDYGVIDFNVGIQGPPLWSGAGAGEMAAVTAVPEPSSALLALAGTLLATRRRPRRRRRSSGSAI